MNYFTTGVNQQLNYILSEAADSLDIALAVFGLYPEHTLDLISSNGDTLTYLHYCRCYQFSGLPDLLANVKATQRTYSLLNILSPVF